jgi:cellulose synthase (UDP-forming)
MATKSYNPSTTLIVGILGLLTLASYALFIFSPVNIGHPIAYTLLIIAEVIGMIQLVGIWTMLVLHPEKPALPDIKETREKLISGAEPASIAVFITVAGEPIEVVTKTIKAALEMDIAHRTVVLDDGASEQLRIATEALGAEYITRPNKDRKKAGNINYALTQVKTDFFAILDCDHVPKKNFLSETLPYLVQDPKVAFVQSPQFFGNIETFVGGGSAESQEVFYRHIQSRKNPANAAFCVGTNVVFRRDAIMELGGIYDKSNSEDIWTAMKLHERGWKSLYVADVLAIGETPDTVDSYFRQQTRWARGGFEILLQENPLFNPKLKFGQRMHYLHTVTFYLSGFSVLIFYMLPLLYTYFNWRPLDVPGQPFVWVLRFLPYYLMAIISNVYLLGRAPLWRSFVMTSTSFPAHISAFLSVITGKEMTWSVTGVIRRKRDYFTAIAPHFLLLLLTAGALPVMLLVNLDDPLAPIFAVWMCWNIAALFSICKRSIPRYAQAVETVSLPPSFAS